MSYDGDSTSVEITELGLLQAILFELKLQTAMLKEMSDVEIEEGDIDG